MAFQDKSALTFKDLTNLRIFLLGPPRVESSSGLLTIPRRQARALLYRLATSMQPIPRERLCYLFWPDESEASARRHLSHLITHLHLALPDPEPFIFVGDQIGLDPQRVWSDVATFEHLCANLSRQGFGPQPQEKGSPISQVLITALEQGVRLYQGAFLEGFSLPTLAEFEEWMIQQRYSLERLYLLALGELIERTSAQGKFESAIFYAQRYLDTDPLAEDVHRRLIELFAVTGNRNAAVRQFETCTRTLERELGVSPLPETHAAYQDALEGRKSLKWVEKKTWKPGPGLEVPLVGRSQIMEELEEAIQKARGGSEKVILISGEAGIGKSRLVHELLARLSTDAAILMGYARPEVRTLPYFPIIQALRSLCGLTEKDTPAPFLQWLPRTLDQIWLIEVTRILPELRRFYPDLPPPLPAASEEARSRLFEALTHFVIGLSTSPVFLRSYAYLLICLEDLHWADSATLDWLIHLGRQIHGHHVLVLGTYRSEEAETVVPLRQGLHAAQALYELQLTGLDTFSILQILSHLTGGVTAGWEEFAEHLRFVSGGNPFFLIEVLKTMMERGWLPEKWGTEKGIPLPDTVREAVEARIQRLSSLGRQILEAGAIAGLRFTFDLVRGIAGRREMEVANGLDELVARELVIEQGPEYRFHHELVRRVVYEALSPLRRQLLHRRAGWMLTRLTPEEPGLVAHHFDLGGETKQALSWYERTIQQAEALFAWKEAEQYQSRMLSLLDLLDPQKNQPDNILKRGLVLLKHAFYCYLQGRLTDRDADLKAVLLLAEKLPEKTLSLLALLHQVRYFNLGGEYEKAILLAEKGTRTLPMDDLSSSSISTLALLFVEIAFAHYLLGQPQEGFSALQMAQSFIGPDPDPKVRGPIEHHLGYMLLHRGEYAQALVHQQEALHCHQMNKDYNGMAWAELDLGFLHLKLGHFLEAKTHLEQSLQLARRISAQPAVVYARTYSGYWKLYQGDYLSAIECFQETAPLHRALLQEHGAIAAEIGWGFALYHLGEIPEARARFQNAVDHSRGVVHRRRWAEALIGLGLVELSELRLELARVILNEAVQLARLSQCNENLAAGLAALARFERVAENFQNSLAYSDEALSIATQFSLPICEIWAELETGLSLLARGEQESALEHTSRAVHLLPHAYEGWLPTEEVYITHAKVLQALGRLDEAPQYLEQAKHLIGEKSQFISDPFQRQRYLVQRFSLIQ